jgi:quercetin dioxygenase-like cupin family protein
MFKRNKSQTTRRERNGLISHFLLQEGDLPDLGLAIIWVDVAPGSNQSLHKHFSEQVYVIIKGRSRIRVGNEEQEVAEGDLVYIPPDAIHGIKNSSDQALIYVSASTPAFDIKKFYDTGELSRKGKE